MVKLDAVRRRKKSKIMAFFNEDESVWYKMQQCLFTFLEKFSYSLKLKRTVYAMLTRSHI